MIFKRLIFGVPVLLSIVSLVAILNVARAIDVSIEGNGAGSNNSANVNQNNQTNVNQNNSANVSNNVDANCNTGGNSASGNTGAGTGVTTGNCEAAVNITNQLNTNITRITCPTCATPTPGASPSPKPNGGAGGPGGNGGGGAAGGGASAGAGQPGVLAATGTSTNLLFALLGLGLVTAGLWQSQKTLR